MNFRYLVLGGGVGEAIASCLMSYRDTKSVTLMDRDEATLARLKDKYSPRLITECADIDEIEQMDFSEYDTVVSALPAVKSPKIARFAIKSKTGFCDLGGVLHTTMDLLQLNEWARKEDVCIVPDCGLMPGLGMILAKKLIYDLGQVESVEILVGGIPQIPKPPTYYTLVFSIDGLRHLCYDPAPVLKDGEIVWMKPMSEYQKIDIPALRKYGTSFNGLVESFITSGAAITPWSFLKLGVKNFAERTIRWPGFRKFVEKIPESKFGTTMLSHINTPVDPSNPDLVFMRVSATTSKGIRGHYDLLDDYDSETRLSAMKRTTGFSTAVIARMIAKKETIPGTNTPDLAIPPYMLNQFLVRVSNHLNISRT